MEFATPTAIQVSTQQPSTSESPWERLLNQPHVVAARQDIANGWRKAHEAGFAHYLRGRPYGLYDEPSTIDDDALSWESTKTALTVSPSMVGLSYDSGIILWKCSGIVVGIKQIVTSAYILGDRRWDKTRREVNVLLPNGDKIPGFISLLDPHHNIAVIYAPDLPDTMTAALFDTNECKLGDTVTAVGHHESSGLLIFPGKINIRKDHLESDDLMSSSCSINERGIGGPLVNNTSGKVVGLNFFSKKCATPFIPSYILLTRVRNLQSSGIVTRPYLATRPYLGVKIRSLNEAKISELEKIYAKFRSTSGVLVTQVKKGSPADRVGICAGDVIISLLKTPIGSPLQFAKVLFENPLPFKPHTRFRTRRTKQEQEQEQMLVEVTIASIASGTIKSCSLCPEKFSPLVIDRWPVLPNDVLQ